LHPNAVVDRKEEWWLIENGGVCVFMKFLEGDFELIKGQKAPLMGWYSSRYGKKEPSGTLTFCRTGSTEDVVFTTAIFTQSPFDYLDKESRFQQPQVFKKAGEFAREIEDS
jgi:hypothetical protein